YYDHLSFYASLSWRRSVFSPRAPAHPALHSFPTRRSSDLAPPRRDPQGAGRLGPGLPHRSRPAALGRAVDPGRLHPHPVQRGGVDRKSTRLNSSHVSISYAVFCLKKKTLSIERNTVLSLYM